MSLDKYLILHIELILERFSTKSVQLTESHTDMDLKKSLAEFFFMFEHNKIYQLFNFNFSTWTFMKKKFKLCNFDF